MAGEAITNVLAQNPCEDSNPPPVKKKRNLPGTPDPEAEVIALSPKTLLATNRFLCEICGKGFQRDQNLQLHRRGHNLPWKLKQRSTKEPRKRVYVCPEKSCVHHHPSRALGDLTGIKKHFCRKHGEKKWKCDKCSKRYAVQSDWKAHMKTCGTREYRCDCGTLFSRRDSFITHRAFCDALAEETARLGAGSSGVSCVTTAANGAAVSSQNPGGSMNSTLVQPIPSNFKPSQIFPNVTVFSDLQSLSPNFFTDPFPSRANPNFLSSIYTNKTDPSLTSLDLTSSSLPSTSTMKQTPVSHLLSSSPSLYSGQQQRPTAPPPDMSATALLQKAAQIGVAAVDPPFLWSLYTKNTEGIPAEDCNKFENLFTVNSTGFSDIPALSQLQGYHLGQREEIGGQTRDFLGVNVQAVCPSSINGWI